MSAGPLLFRSCTWTRIAEYVEGSTAGLPPLGGFIAPFLGSLEAAAAAAAAAAWSSSVSTAKRRALECHTTCLPLPAAILSDERGKRKKIIMSSGGG